MMIEAVADWLGRQFPFVYRVARPPWRFFMRLLSRPGYWEERRHLNYYQEVIRLARAYGGASH